MDSGIEARTLRLGFAPLVAVVLTLASLPVQAQLQISGSQAARFTDNARKTVTNGKSDVESSTSLTATYESEPGRCNASLATTVGYSIWLNDSFDNETSASMNLDSECELATGLFWDLDNSLSEVTQDNTQSDTPANRTRKNIFSSGPRYVWRPGTLDTISLSARYENTEFDEPEETDSERSTGSIAWSHLFSQTFSGGISTGYTKTELDTGAEITVETIRVTFDKRWAVTSVSGSIGLSESETELGSTSQASDGLVGQLDVTRTLNPSANWYLKAARELTDRTSSFDLQFEEFEFNLNESATVQTTSLSTGLRKGFSDQGSLNIEVFANQSDLLETDELEESAGLNLGYSRPIRGQFSGNTSLGYRYMTFEEDQSDDEVIEAQLGLSYQASRELSVSARIGHEQKTSDVRSREYDEFWAQLSVGYRFR